MEAQVVEVRDWRWPLSTQTAEGIWSLSVGE